MDLEDVRWAIRHLAEEGKWPPDICEALNAVLGLHRIGIDLPLRARFWLRLRGYCPVITLKTERWGPVEFYLMRCPSCKQYFIDYPHGYDGYFHCPFCSGR